MQHLVAVALYASMISTALCATCANSNFGGCDKSRGLCWEVDSRDLLEPPRNTTFCTCKAGYRFWVPSTRRGPCRDIDECSTGVHSCDTVHGRCVNTLGSHRCVCNPGYELDFTGTQCLLSASITGRCEPDYPVHTTGFFGEQENEMKQPKSDLEVAKNTLLNHFLRHTKPHRNVFIHHPGLSTCGCEAGFRKCRSNLCQDINECTERTSRCDLLNGYCHNSIGGYFCTCKKGYLLGPCGYHCYRPGLRPTECTSTNLMASTLVRHNSNGRNDEASLALLHDVVTEKAVLFGRRLQALETLQGKACSGSASRTERFDINWDGRIDIIVHLTCISRRYQVKSTFNDESRWDQWTCWTECKATCHGGIQTRTRYCVNGLVGEGRCQGPASQSKTCYHGKKCPLRVRRDANTLTTAQRKDLIQAFSKYKADSSTNGFWNAAGTHVFPNQCFDYARGQPGPCCYHGARLNFAIWHRVELLNIEEGLTRHLKDKTLGLPYWDWLKDDAVPSLVWSSRLYGQPNPFANVTIRYDLPWRQGIQRSPTADLGSIQQARNAYLNTTMELMQSHTLHEFSQELENAHNFIHSSVCSGDTQDPSACMFSIGNLAYAAFDPVFFLHHVNVDRQIARLQHDLARKGEEAWTRQSALEPQESIYHFNEPYNPYRNKSLTAFKKINVLSSMQDLFYYKELLGYEYDTVHMHGDRNVRSGSKVTRLLGDVAKEHIPRVTDALYITQYAQSIGTNVKIAFYVENEIEGFPPLPPCSASSESDQNNPRFVNSYRILGSRLERPWQSRQPVLISMANWLQTNGQLATTNYTIRPCYTHSVTCTANCTGISPTVMNMIPSPQLMLYPRNIREDLLKFQWDARIRMPSWTINVNSATQWIHFWGRERLNIVQVPDRRHYDACSTAGGHRVTCTGSCILPTGYHYFVHSDRSRCRNGLKLSILSTL